MKFLNRLGATIPLSPVALALLLLLAAVFHVNAAPVLDPSFGANGLVRVGVLDGNEDVPSAFALQPDGKLLVAGQSAGRQPFNFVIRFNPDGRLDTTFADNGVARFPIAEALMFPLAPQVEQRPDGSILLNSSLSLLKLTATGQLDTAFGNNGRVENPGWMHFVQQPDESVLLISDASAAPDFAIRLTRLTASGSRDPAFGPNGEKLIGGLPRDFTLTTIGLPPYPLVVAPEADGGFTALAKATIDNGTYLLLRMFPDGQLDAGFGNGGIVSGHDLGRPADVPGVLVRGRDGALYLAGRNALMGSTATTVWKLTRKGVLETSFGSAGHADVSDALHPNFPTELVLTPLKSGGVAVSTSGSTGPNLSNQPVRVLELDASGNRVPGFGAHGLSSVATGGYQKVSPIGLAEREDGVLVVPTWAVGNFSCPRTTCTRTGSDVAVADVDTAGRLNTAYGRGDGYAVWNNAAFSNDRLSMLELDALGRTYAGGSTSVNGTSYCAITRIEPDGDADITFGDRGRTLFTPGCSTLRGAVQPDGSMVIVQSFATGAAGGSAVATRIDSTGKVDTAFKATLAFTDGGAQISVVPTADGGFLYATTAVVGPPLSTRAFVLEKKLSNGSPDLTFGTGGATHVAVAGARGSDMAMLADGTIAAAAVTSSGVLVMKFESGGALSTTFGQGGQFFHSSNGLSFTSSLDSSGGHRLLALPDGSLLATVSTEGPGSGNVVIRIAADGKSSTSSLFAQNRVTLISALPDGSALALLTRLNSLSTSLARVLPDNTLDSSFGPDGAFALTTGPGPGVVDPLGRLTLGGQDPVSAVVNRYLLTAAATSVPVVEYFNTGLNHYFNTGGPGEIAIVDGGGAGPGWQRSGFDFRAFIPEHGVPFGAVPVCRFYGTPIKGPNSHFYTVSPSECAAVKLDPGWTYEGIAFYLFAPVSGRCAEDQRPVYRVYNNRFASNDSNHRYVTNATIYAQMQASGWLAEGVVSCAPAG